MTKTVVIGGGVAGLATATLLAREGHDVLVFEKNDRLGGRAGTVRRDGFTFDTGPSWYLMPAMYDRFFNLAGSSASAELDLRPLDPSYRVFTPPGTGAPVTVPYGIERVQALFEALEPGSGATLKRYLASAKQTTDLAERFFLYNTFASLGSLAHPDVLRRFPRLVFLLGGRLHGFVNRQFRHPVLRQILQYPAIFLGTHPLQAPAMYHLMSSLDLSDGVLYPAGGFTQVINALERLAISAGVRIQTDTEVTEIVCDRSARVTGVRSQSGHVENADIVVSAADLHHTETKLLPRRLQTFPESWWTKRVSGPGAVLVLLGVTGELPSLPHHSLLFTSDWHERLESITDIPVGDRSIYVCKPSATDDSVAPPGHENLFLLIPTPPDPGIGSGSPDGSGDASVERIADAAIDQLAEWAAIPDLRNRIVVRETIGPQDFVNDYHSWRGGMLGPAHTLSQSAMFRAQNASKKVKGLFYAGATTAPGVGVPMCLISAELVLKRVRDDRSAG